MGAIGDKKEIELQHYVSTKDANGDFKETVVKYNLWATVTRQGGSRGVQNGQTGLNNSMLFEIWWKPNIYPTGNWKVVYAGNIYTVSSIVLKDEKRFTWLISGESTGKR